MQIVNFTVFSHRLTNLIHYVFLEHVEVSDLKQNYIGIEQDPFFLLLKTNLFLGINIDKIVLSDNKITEDDKHKIFFDFEK